MAKQALRKRVTFFVEMIIIQKVDPVGFELASVDSQEAEIQDFKEHVLDKESGQTSRYVSFSTAIAMPGGGGSRRFY